MPVGCEMNYVIFRKNSLTRARGRLETGHDTEALRIADELLSIEHADEYLIAIQTMMGFSDDEIEYWQKRLGLVWIHNKESIDFYIPDYEVSNCRWLEFAVLRQKSDGSGRRMPIIWDGYRFVGDKSRRVVLERVDGITGKESEDFPEVGKLL